MLKLEREKNGSERKMTMSGFWVSICMYLWIVLSPSFIVVFPSLWIMNSSIYGQRVVCNEWEL